MAIIKVRNSGYIFSKTKIENFIERINGLMRELEYFGIDVAELEECKNNIIKYKCYGFRDIWLVESIEDEYQKSLDNNESETWFL